MTNSGGGAVKFVLGVEDEKDINSTDNLGVDSKVFIVSILVHHVEEVLSVAEFLIGGINGFTSTVTVTSSSDGRGTTKDTVDVLVSLLTGFVNVGTNVGGVSLGVEGAHSSHEGAHHSHRVSVVSEGLDEGFETFVVAGVLHNLLVKSGKLLGGGEFAINHEEGTFDERGFFSELLDGVTTVLKDSFVSINVRDSRDARDCVHESGIVGAGDFTIGILDFPEISAIDGTIFDSEFILLACDKIEFVDECLPVLLS